LTDRSTDKASGPVAAGSRAYAPLGARLRQGLLWGWSVAGVFIVYVTILAALAPEDERWLGALVIVTYLVVGSFSGAVLGLLLPHLRGVVRRVFMGFLMALIILSGTAVAVERGLPALDDVLTVLAISVPAGAGLALLHTLLSPISPELRGWPLSDEWP
jgi:hypothetical protein